MTGTALGIEPARAANSMPGGEIARVESGSPADLAGLQPGERLIAVNGLVIRDLIDYTYETSGSELELAVDRFGLVRRVAVHKQPGEELGLTFTLPVFAGIRECNNNCEFCFIRGLPKGLRRPLYIRDDDYRYSFLFGTFLTLTNLGETDWQRIGYQRLTPLHVSIHATDLAVRRRMLQNPTAPDILEQLDRLGRLGIEVKGQIVLCPGQNDGAVLERSIADLAARAEVVDSIAIVPVGLSRYSTGRGLRSVTPAEARALVTRARGWQRELRARLGRDFVYLSDEWYLLAGRRFPPAWRYDGYRQLQNGVGLTRLILADWARVCGRVPSAVARPRRVAWLCGRAAAPALGRMADELQRVPGLTVELLEVGNDFFGGGISVSGLLAGQDLAGRLRGVTADLAVLPRSAFGFEGRETLDGWTVKRLERETGVPIALGTSAAELLELTIGG